MSKVNYLPGIKPLDARAEIWLASILDKAGLLVALVTSTTRTPHDQARIMYEGCERLGTSPEALKKGEDAQYALYGQFGDQVIDVYVHCKAMGLTKDAVIAAMEAKIIQLGPDKISKHCCNDPDKSVFDVAPSSIPENKRLVYEGIVQKEKALIKLIRPPIDPAYHHEINLLLV